MLTAPGLGVVRVVEYMYESSSSRESKVKEDIFDRAGRRCSEFYPRAAVCSVPNRLHKSTECTKVVTFVAPKSKKEALERPQREALERPHEKPGSDANKLLPIASQRLLGSFSLSYCDVGYKLSLLYMDSLFEKTSKICCTSTATQRLVFCELLIESFEPVEIFEESTDVFPGNATYMPGRLSIKSPDFRITSTEVISQQLRILLKEIFMEMESFETSGVVEDITHFISLRISTETHLLEDLIGIGVAFEGHKKKVEKFTLCDFIYGCHFLEEMGKLGKSKKRICTQDLLKPSWSLIDLPSIEIPGVAVVNISLNPCVTDIRSRRISTRIHLFGKLIGQALEDHKKKVKKFTFHAFGFIYGCKIEVDCRKIACDIQNELGTFKATFDLENWEELKKIQDETVLVEHIIKVMTMDVIKTIST